MVASIDFSSALATLFYLLRLLQHANRLAAHHSVSPHLHYGRRFCTALYDSKGRLLVFAAPAPPLRPHPPDITAYLTAGNQDDGKAGEVVLSNSFAPGQALLELSMLTRVRAGNSSPLLYLTLTALQPMVNHTFARIIIPPLKYYTPRRVNYEIKQLLLANSAVPAELAVNLDAQLSALLYLYCRLQKAVERWGPGGKENFLAAVTAAINEACRTRLPENNRSPATVPFRLAMATARHLSACSWLHWWHDLPPGSTHTLPPVLSVPADTETTISFAGSYTDEARYYAAAIRYTAALLNLPTPEAQDSMAPALPQPSFSGLPEVMILHQPSTGNWWVALNPGWLPARLAVKLFPLNEVEPGRLAPQPQVISFTPPS